ncbi:transportin-2, partial [Reticulomyxa filosa]
GKKFFEPALMGILNCMGSKSKRVQRSACGSLAELANCFQNRKFHRMSDYVQPIVSTFVKGLALYRLLNFNHLVDVISSVCRVWSLEDESKVVTNPKLMDALIPPLLKRWIAFSESSTCMFPVMECLTRFTSFMGPIPHFQQTYAPSMFQQAFQLACRIKQEKAEYVIKKERKMMMNNNLFCQCCNNNNNNNNKIINNEKLKALQEQLGDIDDERVGQHVRMDVPNLEYWVSAMDMLSAICETTQPAFAKLAFGVPATENKLMEMLYCAILEKHLAVRRNGLALLGDLILFCSDQVGPHIGKFMPLCIENLQPELYLICTNSSWCIGVGLEKYGIKMNIYFK